MATIKEIQQSILEKLIKFGDGDENDIKIYMAMLVAIDKIMEQNGIRSQATFFRNCMNVAGHVYERFKFQHSAKILAELTKATEGFKQ